MAVKMVRARRNDSRDGIYVITPAMAAALLETALPNRKLKEERVVRYVGSLKEGGWRLNGETLIFTDDLRVLNGQHRLHAIVRTGISLETYCVFGIDKKLFPTMDQGSSRTGSDIASIMGFKHGTVCSSLAATYICHQQGKLGPSRRPNVSNSEIETFLRKHRDAVQAAAGHSSDQYKSKFAHVVSVSHVSYVCYRAAENNVPEERIKEFVEKLATGEGLLAQHPILVFRQRMLNISAANRKYILRRDESLALLIKTWNAYIQKKPMKLARWSYETERFPSVLNTAGRTIGGLLLGQSETE